MKTRLIMLVLAACLMVSSAAGFSSTFGFADGYDSMLGDPVGMADGYD